MARIRGAHELIVQDEGVDAEEAEDFEESEHEEETNFWRGGRRRAGFGWIDELQEMAMVSGNMGLCQNEGARRCKCQLHQVEGVLQRVTARNLEGVGVTKILRQFASWW